MDGAEGEADRLPQVPREPTFRTTDKTVVGADIFVDSGLQPSELGASLEALAEGSPLRLEMISNRGTKLYPGANANIDVVDHHRCRFVARDGGTVPFAEALALATAVNTRYEVCHVERLLDLDRSPGSTKAQGED